MKKKILLTTLMFSLLAFMIYYFPKTAESSPAMTQPELSYPHYTGSVHRQSEFQQEVNSRLEEIESAMDRFEQVLSQFDGQEQSRWTTSTPVYAAPRGNVTPKSNCPQTNGLGSWFLHQSDYDK
jgi:hypothetical protein